MVVFSTTILWWTDAFTAASVSLRLRLPFLLLLLLLLLQLQLRCLAGAARCAECFHCTVLSLLLFFLFFTISPPLPLRQDSGFLEWCHRRMPVRLPFWLLARFVDALAPSACAVRCTHGSNKRFSTKSCVYSTHHFLRALNSLPFLLQRISLALSSLVLLRAPPGPELLLLPCFAPPEPFFSSRSS